MVWAGFQRGNSSIGGVQVLDAEHFLFFPDLIPIKYLFYLTVFVFASIIFCGSLLERKAVSVFVVIMLPGKNGSV